MNQIEKSQSAKQTQSRTVTLIHIDHWTVRRLQRFANQHPSVQTCDRCWCRLRGGPPVPVNSTKLSHTHTPSISVYDVRKCPEFDHTLGSLGFANLAIFRVPHT
jgi:hypothetical protein